MIESKPSVFYPMRSLRLLLPLLLFPALLRGATPLPPELPSPVTSFGAAASADGQFFIYGGHAGIRHRYSQEEVHGRLHSWKPGQDAWTLLGTDEPAQGASLLTRPGQVIRIGGMAARNATGQPADLWSSETAAIFDLASQSWRPLPNLPERRSSHDSVLVGDTLYVVGGWALTGREGDGTASKWHETYLTLDLSVPNAAWQSHQQPFTRRAVAVQAMGTKLYAIGGMDEDDEVSTQVDVLDLATGQWSAGPELPDDALGGFGFAAVVHAGRLLASGAAGDLLELRGNQWSPIAKLAHPRYFHRLVPAGASTLLALGGENRKGDKTPPEVIPLPAQVSDWPGYQGPRGNSTTPEGISNPNWPADGPQVAWRTNLGVGMGSFAVAKGKIYASGNDGQNQENLFCLDLHTGAEVWRHTLAVPTQAHEMAIVPNGPGATPTVRDGHVWFVSREGDIVCLDAETGTVAWTRRMIQDLGGKRPVYGYTSSPCVHDGRLYLDIGGTGKSTTCLHALTGEIVWQTGSGEAGYSTPQIIQRDGKNILVLFKGEALELRHAADGALQARHETTTRDFCNCATPVVSDDKIFISHTGNMGARTLKWNGGGELSELWTDRELGLLFHSGLPWRDHLLVFNDQLRGSNELRLIRLATGKSMWQNTDIAKGTGLLCDDGHAILLTNAGELILVLVKESGLHIVSQFQALKPKAWCQPVLSQGHLLVKNNAGDAICYRLEP